MLKKILAHFNCDECGNAFVSQIPVDANTDDRATVFEIALEHIEYGEDMGHFEKHAGANDGQHYCPTCWAPIEEELFIQEIRSGKITREQLESWDMLEEYADHLPQELLTHS
jgi:hypothetical protein